MGTTGGKVFLAVFALAASLLVSGCGSDSTSSKGSTVAQSAAAETPGHCHNTGKYPASPTIEQLDGLLKKGLDPAVPASDKVNLVQGSAGDPDLFNRLDTALRDAAFSTKINDVTDYCDGSANADATLTFGDKSSQAQVPLVAEDGVWKLELGWTCGLVKNLNQTSPLCP